METEGKIYSNNNAIDDSTIYELIYNQSQFIKLKKFTKNCQKIN